MTDSSEYKFKAIRDSIYGYIWVSRTEYNIINTPAFRRLHRIMQLSHSYLVYPTATHTRYEHALGAMHMVSMMCDHLGVDGDLKRLARLAALLHDIGHGPFSHTFEEMLEGAEVKIPHKDGEHIHEVIGKKIIMDDHDIIECLKDERHVIVSILDKSDDMDERYTLIADIVSGNLDADKLDYFARDSYNLGVKYGVVDTERILHVLRKDKNGTRVGIHPKGVPVMESYRMARYLIGRQIYTHRARVAADQMFIRAAHAAFDEGVLDRDDFDSGSNGFVEFYNSLDDASFVHKIMWHDDSELSSEIFDCINKRRLLKACYEGYTVNASSERGETIPLDTKEILLNAASEIRGKLELDEHELFAHESDLQLRLFNRRDFLVIDDQGNVHDMLTLSPIHARPAVFTYYVFGKADKREEITQMLRDKGIKTELIT